MIQRPPAAVSRAADIALAVVLVAVLVYLVAVNAPKLLGGVARGPMEDWLVSRGYNRAELEALEPEQITRMFFRDHSRWGLPVAILVGLLWGATRIGMALGLTAATAQIVFWSAVASVIYAVLKGTGQWPVVKDWVGLGEPCEPYGGVELELGLYGGETLYRCVREPWLYQSGRGHFQNTPV